MRGKGGRADPKNISYLYIAEDLKTTMMEVRHNLTQKVSVATIKILKTLRLFDFCYVDSEEKSRKKFGFKYNINCLFYSKFWK